MRRQACRWPLSFSRLPVISHVTCLSFPHCKQWAKLLNIRKQWTFLRKCFIRKLQRRLKIFFYFGMVCISLDHWFIAREQGQCSEIYKIFLFPSSYSLSEYPHEAGVLLLMSVVAQMVKRLPAMRQTWV